MTEASTANLLHPRQVVDLNDQKTQLQAMLGAAPHIRSQLQDGGANIHKQIKGIDKTLEQAPKPYAPEEIDSAVFAEKELREMWLQGMPTKAEMRKNPPGATDKNMLWQKNQSANVLKWKHIRRRLDASDITENRLVDRGDVSNIEMFRPDSHSGEMSMDNAQISGTHYKLPPPGAAPVTVLSDEEIARVKAIDPDITLAALNNEDRAKVKEFIADLGIEKPKNGWTPERRAKASEAAKARIAAKKQEG